MYFRRTEISPSLARVGEMAISERGEKPNWSPQTVFPLKIDLGGGGGESFPQNGGSEGREEGYNINRH